MSKRYAPATERNREAILAVLKDYLPDQGTVLEIASGTGQHAVFFAQHLASRYWLPTDRDALILHRSQPGTRNLVRRIYCLPASSMYATRYGLLRPISPLRSRRS